MQGEQACTLHVHTCIPNHCPSQKPPSDETYTMPKDGSALDSLPKLASQTSIGRGDITLQLLYDSEQIMLMSMIDHWGWSLIDVRNALLHNFEL